MTDTLTLADMVRLVYLARKAHDDAKMRYDALHATWLTGHADLISEVVGYAGDVVIAEATLREPASGDQRRASRSRCLAS